MENSSIPFSFNCFIKLKNPAAKGMRGNGVRYLRNVLLGLLFSPMGGSQTGYAGT
ncbi:MAG: hypothetical protein FD168_377 [Desulfobulbaceae bacterium]|nr:MAG: hypothetical protein FD168_377 [Desulfobulbaceae bacterium]